MFFRIFATEPTMCIVSYLYSVTLSVIPVIDSMDTTGYKNILDFYEHVRDMNLCTTPFCTTCGASEYRNLCKSLGIGVLRRLLEATTKEDLENTRPELWYDPLTIMLYDGFTCNRNCPIMQSYDKGFEWLVYGDANDLLFMDKDFRVYAKTGSIFEEQNVDVLALFDNTEFYKLSYLIDSFFTGNSIAKEPNRLIPFSGTIGNVHAIYYARTSESQRSVREVKRFLFSMLDTVSGAGYSSIAMNGIKTLGYSEYDNARIIKDWRAANPKSILKKIYLIDKRAGFTKLARKAYL